MFTMGHSRKYVYPSLFFLLLFLLMLLRMSVSGAMEGPGVVPGRAGEASASGTPSPHSEEDFLNAVHAFNAAVNPRTERDNAMRDTLMLAAREERVRNLEKRWRQANGSFFTWMSEDLDHGSRNYSATYGDRRYGHERNRLDEQRSRDMQQYRNERCKLVAAMKELDRQSDEYRNTSRKLRILDLDRIHQESEYEKEYKNLDLSYSLRSH